MLQQSLSFTVARFLGPPLPQERQPIRSLQADKGAQTTLCLLTLPREGVELSWVASLVALGYGDSLSQLPVPERFGTICPYNQPQCIDANLYVTINVRIRLANFFKAFRPRVPTPLI